MSGNVYIIPMTRDGRLPPETHQLIDLCIVKYTGQPITDLLVKALAADVQQATGWAAKASVYNTDDVALMVLPPAPKIIVGGGQ